MGQVTDPDGRFRLSLDSGKAYVLQISFVGMQQQERTVSRSVQLEISMTEKSQMLNDVVITGYNVKKNRTELVGSVVQVDSKELQAERPVESFEKLLSGQVAGLQINNVGGGEAGVPNQVRIRGQGSLPGNNFVRTTSSEPLYVLDGVPLYDIQTARGGPTTAFEQRLNPLASLNPEDIESISVLKDASASSIYGANAANGVILITTKRGRSGKLKVDFSITQGITEPINQLDLLDTQEYVELYREAMVNAGVPPEEAIERAGPTDIETDWESITLQNASFTQTNLSLSGGGNSARARVSFNYLSNETVSQGNNFERFTSRANVDVDFSEKFSARYSLNFTLTGKNSLGQPSATNAPPNISPFNPDGTFNNSGRFENLPNPLAAVAQNDNEHRGLATNGNVNLQYLITPNLQVTGLAGIDYYQNTNQLYFSKFNASGFNRNGYLNIVNRQNMQWITNIRVRWGKRFDNGLQVSFLAGAEAQEQTTWIQRTQGQDFPYDDLRNIQNSLVRDGNSSEEEVSTVSWFAESNLEWKDRYFVTVNSRSDASSIFGGDVRTGRFFSAGAGWLISQEEFYPFKGFIENMKLRGTYGTTGNSRIGSYAARGLYRIGSQYNYANQGGIFPITAENPLLTWEKNYKTDIGIELDFTDRLRLVLQYYQNDIKDAISTIDVPYESGFVNADINAADMRNSGWEVTLRTVNIRKENFEWSTNFNLSTNKNIITDLKLKESDIRGGNAGVGLVEGEDVRTIYGRQYAGVDPFNGKPLWQLPDGSLTDDFRLANEVENLQKIGTSNPAVFGGFINNFNYKNWSVSIITSYSIGSDIRINNLYETDGRQFAFNNQSKNLLDRWQQPGDWALIPRLHLQNQAILNASRFLYDNDHLKIENINLSYRFNTNTLRKLKLSAASIFAQVTNLTYFYFQNTPENRNGIEQYRFIFPEGRTWTAGLRISI